MIKSCSHSILVGLSLLVMTDGVVAHGDMHEQIAAISKQIDANPKDAVLFHKRGEMHRAHGDFPEALADFAAAEKLDPKMDVVLLSRGRALSEAGKQSEAMAPLNAFIKKHTKHPEALWLRARAHVSRKALADAEADFRVAMEKMTQISPDQYIERANNLEAAQLILNARQVIDDGIKRLGPIITLELRALDLELAAKDYPAALIRIDRLLEKAPRKETYLVRKAEAFERMGRKTEAQQCYAKALQEIEALPERLRNVKATSELEKDVRARLAAGK